MQNKKQNHKTTSWEKVSSWYDQAVGDSGHYYHEHIIFPKLLPWFSKKSGAVLDLACGQGILSRHLPEQTEYMGIDISPSLIQSAVEKNHRKNASFYTADITLPLPIQKKDFSFCTILLALQNIEKPLLALKNAAKHLAPKGKLFLVMNHPCFRIPKNSDWGIDEGRQVQYRRMDRYASSLKIPIQVKPSLGDKSDKTFSFHHPLSMWTQWLSEAGFAIETMEEWYSDKKSTGRYALREDKSRKEFPLFLTIKAFKL